MMCQATPEIFSGWLVLFGGGRGVGSYRVNVNTPLVRRIGSYCFFRTTSIF